MTTRINHRNITNTGVVAGVYPSANVTVNQQGQVTSISRGNIELSSVKTSDFLAEAKTLYPCDTRLGSFTATLPTTANPNETIVFRDYAGSWRQSNLIINPGTTKINGKTGLLRLVDKFGLATFFYLNSTIGWQVTYQSAASTQPILVEYLVVGGGGGGGKRVGGGGGAGGLLYGLHSVVGGIDYQVTIGAGGGGAIYSNVNTDTTITPAIYATGFTGQASRFDVLVAQGGGGGASSGYTLSNSGLDGGSGGGGSVDSFTGALLGSGGYPLHQQGNQGAQAASILINNFIQQGGGGGGGGAGGSGTTNNITGGNGGRGARLLITGASTYYAGGGGGGAYNIQATAGLGGIGGGGAGGVYGLNGNSGITNSGGGGGASSNSTSNIGGIAGTGGSGIVIVAYPDVYPNLTSITSGLRVNSAQFQGTINGTILTVNSIVYGKIVVGAPITGSNVLANTYISGRITGTGGLGTYYVSETSFTNPNITLTTTGSASTPDLLSRTGYKIYEFTAGNGYINW